MAGRIACVAPSRLKTGTHPYYGINVGAESLRATSGGSMSMFGWLATKFCSFPRFDGKEEAFGFLFQRAPYDSAVSFYGVRMINNISDRTFRFAMVGSYGRFISDWIKRQDCPFCFIDIGANQGLYSLLAALNPFCERVVSFEPVPGTFSYLVRNIVENGLEDRIVPICAAIAPGSNRLATFSVPTGHSGAASSFDHGDSKVPVLTIDARTIAEVLAEGPDARLLCKIDVEGSEKAVLQILQDAHVLQRIDALVIEVSDRTGAGGQSKELLQFMDDLSWVMKSRDGSWSHYDALFTRGQG